MTTNQSKEEGSFSGGAVTEQALPIEVLYAIRQAHEFAIHAPHGDNCYLTDDYPGNDCICGKESLENALHEVSCKYDPQYGDAALSSQSEAR